MKPDEKTNLVKLLTLDPGHFHAALVQKKMYPRISPVVHVYAPDGDDIRQHTDRIEQFNTRKEEPTNWTQNVYTGPDFLEKMLSEKKGNVVVLAGNNSKKAEYIKTCVDAGLNVLADKPMCIDAVGFKLLKQAFISAEKNNVLIYDIMTERFEITSILQKKLAAMSDVFGELLAGSADQPAVEKESVHHFFKQAAGKPLKRPPWYFDVAQQGDGIVDVTTHLVDLVMWACLPEQIVDYQKDIELVSAKRWPTLISPEQFEKVTSCSEFPDFLENDIDDNGKLACFANGRFTYKLKDIHAAISVVWDFQAPPGAGDTHYSILRGTKANLIIRQGKEQNFQPQLYIEPAADYDSLSKSSTVPL